MFSAATNIGCQELSPDSKKGMFRTSKTIRTMGGSNSWINPPSKTIPSHVPIVMIHPSYQLGKKRPELVDFFSCGEKAQIWGSKTVIEKSKKSEEFIQKIPARCFHEFSMDFSWFFHGFSQMLPMFFSRFSCWIFPPGILQLRPLHLRSWRA